MNTPPRALSPWSPLAHDKHTMRADACTCTSSTACYTLCHICTCFLWMSETVDLIYDLMNNVCGSNWMGLLGINVCSSFSAVFDKSNNNKKIKKTGLNPPTCTCWYKWFHLFEYMHLKLQLLNLYKTPKIYKSVKYFIKINFFIA